MRNALSRFLGYAIYIWAIVVLGIAVIALDVFVMLPIGLIALIAGESPSDLKESIKEYNAGMESVFTDLIKQMKEL